jgi:hypothetical protein
MAVSRDWSARRVDWTPQSEDARDDSDVDYARVIHSASFRRLQGKTHILNLGDSDFYRTRLTHSLEVARLRAASRASLRSPIRIIRPRRFCPIAAPSIRSVAHTTSATRPSGMAVKSR